jgi:hypothetical protein
MIEKSLAISSENNSYIQFVNLTEHAMTPTRVAKICRYDTTVPARVKELIRTDQQNLQKDVTAKQLLERTWLWIRRRTN